MTSSTSQLHVQHININELKASEFNPRTWSDHQLAKLRESIEKFGVVDPLIINTTNLMLPSLRLSLILAIL